MSTSDTLREFARCQDMLAAGSRLTPELIERHMARLLSFRRHLRSQGHAPVALRDGLEEARRRWGKSLQIQNLTHREIRILCGDRDTLANPGFVSALEAQPVAATKAAWIAGLVSVYTQHWSSLPTIKSLESLLARLLAGYRGRNPWVLRLTAVRDKLVSRNAATWIAQLALERRGSPGSALQHMELPAGGDLSRAANERLVDAWVALLQGSTSEGESLSLLNYFLETILSADADRGAYAAVGTAIQGRWADKSDRFRARLRTFVLQNPLLGDPRLPANGPNWTKLPTGARDRVLSWLAHESVRFFFETILPNQSENRARGQFWLRYHHRIVDFRVALSEEDEQRVRARVRTTELPQYSLTSHATTSAFIMKLSGQRPLYVVEFSETNNAAYLFTTTDFLAAVRSDIHRTPRLGRSFDIANELKAKTRCDRILHNVGWQRKAAATLAQYGIRP